MPPAASITKLVYPDASSSWMVSTAHLPKSDARVIHIFADVPFNPSTGALWGWTEKGPVTINTTTGAATLVKTIRGYTVDGLAWSNDGATLYLAESNRLYTYNPVTHAIKRIDTFKRKIEALEMGPDGYLLMGQNELRKVVIYDPLAQRMVHGIEDDHHPEHRGWHRPSWIIDMINVSPYNDPEGIAWNVCNP